MSQDVNKNKVNAKQKRRAEHLEDKYEKKGMGQDEAEKRALATAAEEPNSGGSHSAGDPKKGANQEGGRRRGSDKEAE